MAYSTVWMPSNGLFDSLDAINGIDCLHMSCRADRCVGLLVCCACSFDSCAQCYGMLWFEVPTALLRVQRPCSVPGEVVLCSFCQEPQPWQSRTRRMNEALTTGVP